MDTSGLSRRSSRVGCFSRPLTQAFCRPQDFNGGTGGLLNLRLPGHRVRIPLPYGFTRKHPVDEAPGRCEG